MKTLLALLLLAAIAPAQNAACVTHPTGVSDLSPVPCAPPPLAKPGCLTLTVPAKIGMNVLWEVKMLPLSVTTSPTGACALFSLSGTYSSPGSTWNPACSSTCKWNTGIEIVSTKLLAFPQPPFSFWHIGPLIPNDSALIGTTLYSQCTYWYAAQQCAYGVTQPIKIIVQA